jgi:TPR repeat protein
VRLALGCVFSVLLVFAQNDPSAGSHSTRRRALLIGNSSYKHLPELRTPKANVEALAATLAALQIPSEVAYDLTQAGMLSILQKFATDVQPGDLVMVYFSGYGYQQGEINYLLPVSFDPAGGAAPGQTGVSVRNLLKQLDLRSAGIKLLLLDACRPGSGLSDGLAMELPSANTLISFSAAPNQSAPDPNDGRLNAFTAALINAIREPGATPRIVLTKVQGEVSRLSDGKQVPFVIQVPVEEVPFLDPTAPTVAAPAIRRSGSPEAADAFFSKAKELLLAKNYTAALPLLQQAADAGSAKAMSQIGAMYQLGQGVQRDYGEAMIWYRKAADTDGRLGLNALGWLYHNGWGVNKDDTEALRLFRKAADAGNGMAMTNIGSAYLEGWGVPRDPVEAMKWTRKAVDAKYDNAVNPVQDHATALYQVGWFTQNGWGVARDNAEALRWYRKAADEGHAQAMSQIGYFYENGWAVSRDYAEAMRWYRKAADAGGGYGMRHVGELYRDGLGVAQDFGQAMAWMQRASDAGEARAMNEIGVMYSRGQGAARDFNQAMKWYRKAADAGVSVAAYNVAMLLQEGKIGPADYAGAMKWHRKAADAGFGESMNQIGRFYEHGLGVGEDRATAISWYRKAATAGSADARTNLERLGISR